ncbi:MAG: hypothetical protein OEM67_07970 [Thermoleophilia bacterium]|nr:hypothetical protein [Thermoleophilia bacterium]MDH3725608.1 hypothetical protein [Thermoleophilia bacterium]
MASLPPKNAAAPDPDPLDGSIRTSARRLMRGRATPEAESLGATRPHTPDGTTEVMAARIDGLPHERTFVSDEAGPPIMIRRAVTPRPGQSVAPASLVKLVEKSARPTERVRVNSLRRRLEERRRAITRRSQARQSSTRLLPSNAEPVPSPEPEPATPVAATPTEKQAASEPRREPRPKAKAAPPPPPAPSHAFRTEAETSEESLELARHRSEVADLRGQLRQALAEVDFWRRSMLLSLLIAGGAAAAFFWPF